MTDFKTFEKLINTNTILLEDYPAAIAEMEFTIADCEATITDPEVEEWNKAGYRQLRRKAITLLAKLK
jgi:hypothetical protein